MELCKNISFQMENTEILLHFKNGVVSGMSPASKYLAKGACSFAAGKQGHGNAISVAEFHHWSGKGWAGAQRRPLQHPGGSLLRAEEGEQKPS